MGNIKSKVHSEALLQLYSLHNSDASLVVAMALFAWPFHGNREAILSEGGSFVSADDPRGGAGI